MSLTEQEILRYSRHIILPEVGGRGQRRIKAASVLVAGLGAVGSAAALYLAAAGVGRITLWDPAQVSAGDLDHAIAHNRQRLGTNRARSAQMPLQAINPDAEVVALDQPDALLPAIAEHQVVVATQGDWLVIQATAVQAGVAALFAGVAGASGAALAYRPGEPCLGCVDPSRAASLGLRPEGQGGHGNGPESPGTGGAGSAGLTGVVSAAGGLMGVVAATETIKLVLSRGLPLTGRIFAYAGWEAHFREVPVPRRADCPYCGAHHAE